MSRADIASGAVLAALGGFVVVEALKWDYLSADGPGPGFFPFWYGAAMIALALGLVAAAVVKRHARAPLDWSEVGRALAAWAAFAAAAALMEVLGFALAFALLTAFVVRVMYGRPLTEAVIAGVGGAVAFYLVFPLALEVSLPRGIAGF